MEDNPSSHAHIERVEPRWEGPQWRDRQQSCARPTQLLADTIAFITYQTHNTTTLHSTVEPPNNGHIGTNHFVIYREIVLSSEV